MRKIFFIVLVLIVGFLHAQKKLRVGQKIPSTTFEVFNADNQSVKFELSSDKKNTDRFVLVLFYSTSQPIRKIVQLNYQIELILNKFQNNACKGTSEIEYITVCADVDAAKWKSYLSEGNLLQSRFRGKKSNFLCKIGQNDKCVLSFGVSQYPSFFVVNPNGRLWLEADSANVLDKAFVNICRNNASASTADIAGKLLVEDLIKKPLTDLKVFLVNQIHDTIKTTKTDNYGDFVFTKVDTTQHLSIRIEQNEKVKAALKIYLAKQSGEIVTEIKKSVNGIMEYHLLKADVVNLSPTEEEDDITLKYKNFDKSGSKNLSVTENIYYEKGKYNVNFEAELILDKVVAIMQANPSVKLEMISHTDSQGDDASNMILSQKRAFEVMTYLIQKGINKNNINAIGKGESEILNRCLNGVECSDKEHEYNRRTEFKFIKD